MYSRGKSGPRMSFLIDPPLLFLSGVAIYIIGRRLDWNRQSKIVVGLGIALIFIIFSSLLYADLIRCTFPFFSGMKGHEFMLHSNLTGISKAHENGLGNAKVKFDLNDLPYKHASGKDGNWDRPEPSVKDFYE